MARVILACSSLLSPLDDAIAGLPSTEAISWTDELHTAFTAAIKALSSSRSITLPKPDEQLWIVTDGALRKPGIGATLYVTRQDTLHLAGCFSAKIRNNQSFWLPCEVEALAIATAVKHFSPYLVQSTSKACVLTDSKPCVQAYQKLCRGEFSTSPRVSTFLSTICRYQVLVQYIAGASILPSDFASRNAPECRDMACQVCNFINTTQSSVIRRTSVAEILADKTHLPFTSRAAWLSIQAESPDLRRTHAHLRQGTRPSKKTANITYYVLYHNDINSGRTSPISTCAFVRLCIELRPLDGPPAVIRTDPSPGFKALVDDPLLRSHRLSIEIGRVKSNNKNPVAERAVQELQNELLRQDPSDGYVSPLALSTATASLNSRIRIRGLSAREMWYQRDQFSNSQLPVDDRQLITSQHETRVKNHPYSEKSKAPRGKMSPSPYLHIGDLDYLYADRDKS